MGSIVIVAKCTHQSSVQLSYDNNRNYKEEILKSQSFISFHTKSSVGLAKNLHSLTTLHGTCEL